MALRVDSSHTTIKYNKQKNKIPNIYVEVYVPIMAKSGEKIGTIKTYIDQTEMLNSLKSRFYWIALLLPIISAFLLISYICIAQKKCSKSIYKDEGKKTRTIKREF